MKPTNISNINFCHPKTEIPSSNKYEKFEYIFDTLHAVNDTLK